MLTKRMAMRRMNEMCRRMALTLVFYVLLFHICQGQSETTEEVTHQTSAIVKLNSTQTFSGGATDPSITNSTNSPATEVNQVTDQPNPSTQDILTLSAGLQRDTAVIDEHNRETLSTPETTTSQSVVHGHDDQSPQGVSNTHVPSIPHDEKINQSSPLSSIAPRSIPDAQVSNTDVPSIPHDEKINHSSPLSSIAPEFIPDAQSGQPHVFVPVLVCGLILAAALIGGYVVRNRYCRKASGMKLAEESYMTDEDNQGNTLVSVAPLNPPESSEKPSQNGESLEAVKIQNPPAATNGHSTTKADTEL
ncbi:hypothetical protein PHYPO_G00072740 [Pangasianodon hypophthalmus]|uniref:Uncharacterized protein n=1 Tax=Pangasianodon hypophthalmus TaxID=310915 RepID=A0A5N5LUF0_PANHP|nr:hypothetical protein PHYPO_G00072740 [Pangasianodon hypophthalmus]